MLALLVLPLLTGCWDRLEIEDRAVVLGVSIDTVKSDGVEDDAVTHMSGAIPSPKSGYYHVAVQIALPGRIPLGPGEGGGGTTDSSQTVWVLDTFGHSLDDAFMRLQQQTSSRLFFGHLRVIIVSEAVAKKGMDNINDFFRRNSEVRRMAWMMIAKGNAMKLMKAAPKLERIPTLYLMTTLDQGIKMGKFPRDYIGTFWSNSTKKGQEGYLPYVELQKEQNIEIKGLAYFKGAKMVGKTKPIQIGTFMAVKGINPAGYRVFITLDGTSKLIMISTTSRHVSWKSSIKEGHPHFDIDIVLEINIEEKMDQDFDINREEILRQIELKLSEGTTKACKLLLAQTQENSSDIFGFGEYIRAKKSRYWNAHVKTKEQWQEQYKDITFDIKTDVNVRRVGMKAK
ncbi:Ger(x)C family spore germination protein [Paenibacillus cellulosilyticus]|nr:Ger(x)C family spore germination protein [Paenibacillus cellulosilyticus]